MIYETRWVRLTQKSKLINNHINALPHNSLAHLWSDVVRCSTESLCGNSIEHVFFAHAKVGYLYMAFRVQHHVVQLQIPENKRTHTDFTHTCAL